ncbi:ABC transporter substrate-binding protein [Gulosibacter molinativorax]|nr:ABC transporter substrate-binding protein [Gulosibacter molinativorax]QUY62885.1 Hypotetical protein [Gulosibacter molinativorax]
MNKKLIAGLAMTAVAAMTLTGCAANGGDGAEGDSVVIGRILPLTGALAGTGNRVADGSEIAREIINENGGINGVMVEYVTEDAPDDESARQAAERLLNQDIDIVMGTFGSSLALAAIPVITGEGGLYWETGASAVGITDGTYDNIYRASLTAKDIGVDAVTFAAEQLADDLGKSPEEMTVGWAGVNTSYGEDVFSGVTESAETYGMEIVLNAAYPVDSTDLNNVALQIRDANPDILILTSYDADAAALGRAMRASDVNPPVVIGSGGGHVNESWIESMGSSGNGVFNVGFSTQLNTEGLSDQAKAYYDEFIERYGESNNGAHPGAFDMNGFMGAMALFDTMMAADELTPEGIAAAADTIDIADRSNVDGSGLRFNEFGQNEAALFFVSQWQDGEIVPVFPVDLALAEPENVPLPAWDER